MPNLSQIAVVIPSLEPEEALLLPFLDQLVQVGFGAIVVIDDGSPTSYRPVFDAAASRPGVVVLRHDVNRGKGRALKTAFEYCAGRADLAGVVTADSDGQHAAADLVRVAERTLTVGPRTAVFGSREFTGVHVPRNSRMGNQITSRVVKVLFGQWISDTQTGLRGFPIGLAHETAAVKGERFEYEMNVLLWLIGNHVRVDEVPIETIYHDLDNSVSHFSPVKDSARIYGVILKQAGKFVLSSLAGSAIDLGLYAALVDLAFRGSHAPAVIIGSTIAARVVSSLANYALNRRAVFEDRSSAKASLVRYYSLAAGLMAASALGTAALAQVLQGHLVWAKVIVDGLLFVVSFLVQKRWVFRDHSLEAHPGDED